MATIIHPLKFFNYSPNAQQVMQANPGSVLDLTSEPGLLIPVCSACGTGEGLLREEKGENARYRCVACGFHTDWITPAFAAQQWANMNNPNTPTN